MFDLWRNRYEISKNAVIKLYDFCVKDFSLNDFCAAFGIDPNKVRNKDDAAGHSEAVETTLTILYGIPHAIYSRWPKDGKMMGLATKAFDHIWSALSDIVEYDDVTSYLCGSTHPMSYFEEDIKALGWSDVVQNFEDEYAECGKEEEDA